MAQSDDRFGRNPSVPGSLSLCMFFNGRTLGKCGSYIVVFTLALLAGCGGNVGMTSPTGTTPTGTTPVGTTPTGTTPTGSGATAASVQHVVIVVEENHSFDSVIGSSSMPYLNGLASQYSLATNYYGDIHPSLPNYFMLTTGELVAIDDAFTGTYSGANLASVVSAAGKTWKMYAENLPSVGYLGGDQYPYARHHNPFTYFDSVINDPKQAANIVPFTQFAADIAAGSLPSVSFILPNLIDDAHDGTLAQADAWLKTNIDPLVKSTTFANTILIVTFDEGDALDIAHLGGHVATLIAGGPVKTGYKSTTLYQHESTLRFMLDALGIPNPPGAAANAPSMNEFLK